MSLVHSVERDLDGPEEGYVLALGQRLGRHIEDFGPALLDIVLDFLDLRTRKRGVEEVGHIVVAGVVTHGVDLILHKGYKRRDNDGGTLTDDGRKLVAKRLATACRHNHEGVVAVEQTLDYGFLVTLEVVKSENLFQFRLQYAAICVQYD